MKKTLLKNLVLSVLPLTIACGDPAYNSLMSKQRAESTPTPQPTPNYTFDKFGKIGEMPRTRVFVTDMNGDGAPDVVCGDSYGNVFVYENRIPQKNQTQKPAESYK